MHSDAYSCSGPIGHEMNDNSIRWFVRINVYML